MTEGMLILFGLAVMLVMMLLLWVRQRGTRNASDVDVAWTVGVGVLGATWALFGPAPTHRRHLIAGIVGLWALRLAVHLILRIRGGKEDRRYAGFRAGWGEAANSRFFVLYQIQGLWAVLFALPAFWAARSTVPGWQWTDVAGAAVAAIALLGESVADRQLRSFVKSAPPGSVCDVGLWGWSRHPNYFFEWLHWWSYVLIGWSAPMGYLLLLGPALMALFLFKVTGIPILEEAMVRSRGEPYRAYQRRVSAFIPLPPRKEKSS